jgi:hypothetical protein
LEFVELLTRHAYKNTPADVAKVRSAGWSDEQIAEGVYITAMFAFFNRVADAFGLADPKYLPWRPREWPEPTAEHQRHRSGRSRDTRI